MSRFLRTLAKVGLVELDASEQQRLEEPQARDGAGSGQGGSAEPGLDEAALSRILSEGAIDEAAPPAHPPASMQPLAEGVSFEELYRGAQVPSSPFPAEKLLKLLDGLRAMDPAMRKAAVLAMDAADDAWTIDDAVLDAERKVRALRKGSERLGATLAQNEEAARAEVAALDDYAQKAADTIRKQIGELEQLLQKELEAAAQKKAEVQANMRVARDASARERTRYEQEVARLEEIHGIFGAPPAPRPQAR